MAAPPARQNSGRAMDKQEHSDRLDIAARWYAELQASDTDVGVWDAFRAWEKDPLNAAAFREIEAALSAIDRTSLGRSESARDQQGRRAGAWLAAMAAGLVLAGIAGLTLVDRTPVDAPALQRLVFETAKGEQRRIELSDGSVAELNTASRIEVAYSADARLVQLSTGQALFEVRPGSIPFIVESSGTRTRALGTEFDVYLKSGGAEITLVEGSVSVVPGGDTSGEGVVLLPGEQVTVEDGVAGPVRKVDLGAEIAWRTGTLQFRDATLADAVAEMNRYSETTIIVEDQGLSSERLSGAFKAGDQEKFVSALSMFLPVSITRSGSEIRISRAAD